MRQMYCETLHRQGELLVSVEWFCGYLFGCHVSTCDGAVYVTDHFADFSVFLVDLIRDIFHGTVIPKDYSMIETFVQRPGKK